MSPQPLAPGRRIGPYTLIEALGEGGMAQVFVAKRDRAADVCVLKLLHLGLVRHGEAARRFQREAHIASQLDHPCITPVTDAGWDDEQFYLAMPLIAGVTVEALIEGARGLGGILPFEVSVPLALQALDALQYAHTLRGPEGRPLGIVHRDLSPRNLMIGFDGRLRLIDFGVAKGQIDEFKTASGVLMGTPYYMSPEQAQALRVDARSDLYTLAAVLFEMITGTRLAQGKGRVGILVSVTRDVAPRASQLNMHAPPALDAVLARALEKDPDARYPDAAALADALQTYGGAFAQIDEARTARFVRGLFPDEATRADRWTVSHPVTPTELGPPGAPHEQTRTEARPVSETAIAPLPLDPLALTRAQTRTALLPGRGESLSNQATALAPAPSGAATTASTEPSGPEAMTTAALSRPTAPRSGWAGGLALLLLAGLGVALVTLIPNRERPAPVAAPAPPPRPAAAPAARPAAAPISASPITPAKRPSKPRPAAAPRRPAPRPAERAARIEARPPAPRAPPPRAPKRRTETSNPTPTAKADPPPAEAAAAAPAPASKTARLRARLAKLQKSRDKSEALALARALRSTADGLDAPAADRVRLEVERVYLTGDVDIMIKALSAALRAIPSPRGG